MALIPMHCLLQTVHFLHFSINIRDPLSKNPTCLHNSVFEVNTIEIHWAKMHYINNFTHVLIASVNSEG